MRLGIDFGTTRIVVAASDRGNYPVVQFESADGEICDWFPPLVGVRGGERIYGWEAWQAQNDSEATVVRSLKRFLAEAGPQTLVEIAGERAPLAVLLRELAGALMRALRENPMLRLEPDEPVQVMLGVPAGANSNQRFLTVEGFRQAGFDVIGLLNEPSAASIEYGHSHREKASKKDAILIYDLGGGTFDASLVELDDRSHAVLATEGIATLGGDDFDDLLAEMALEQAGVDPDSLSQAAWFRLEEEARRKKEGLHPNSRRLTLDLEVVRPDLTRQDVLVADFFARCEPLVAETLHAVQDLTAATASLEAIYVTGGGSEMPLVSRLLREVYKTKVRRSPYTRAATAIGLAIHADHSADYVLRDHFTRYFGVWREADGGATMRFDPLFAKGSALPHEGEPPIVQSREYFAVHNIGHFRYLECSRLDEAGQPAGDITLWDEIHVPFDPALYDAPHVDTIPVVRTGQHQLIAERYRCGTGGELLVTIANVEARYEKTYRLGRWGALADPIVPGKKRKTAARRKTHSPTTSC
ncbi:MAG TPA: Hsp70 family protein [Bryobacteraceae bacterium]|nr:Hsp70 family protein [Bryobacteraceae bacterium]